jgi:glutamyl/glutaminyl-tRNA synthetase
VRARTLAEPTEVGRFFIADAGGVSYDAPAVAKTLLANEGEGLRILAGLLPEFKQIEPWSVEELEKRVTGIMQAQGLDMKRLGQPLRIAVSGSTVTPPLFETLVILGKEQVLRRIERCLNICSPPTEKRETRNA